MRHVCKQFKIGVVLIGLALTIVFFLPFMVKGAVLSPTQVVHLWIQLYPHQMKQAAALATSRLRGGLPREEWIQKQETMLKDLQFRYLGGKVVSESVTGDQAVVVFHAKFSTLNGKQIHKEEYRLRKQLDGGWLIDQIEFGPEHFLRPRR